MPAPVPVLSNVIPVVNPHDLKFVMSKLDRDTLNELFASLGIAVQGSIEEVLHYCAFSGPWDYTKTKKLREFYTLSFDAHRLTGFLVEGPMNFPFERLFDLLDKTKRMNRRDSQNEDDLRGIIDVSPIDGVLTCYNGPRNLDSQKGKNKVPKHHAQTLQCHLQGRSGQRTAERGEDHQPTGG